MFLECLAPFLGCRQTLTRSDKFAECWIWNYLFGRERPDELPVAQRSKSSSIAERAMEPSMSALKYLRPEKAETPPFAEGSMLLACN
jgi:hypothetical protein